MIKYIYLGSSTWGFVENDIEIKVPSSKAGDSLDTALQREGLYLLTEKEYDKLLEGRINI